MKTSNYQVPAVHTHAARPGPLHWSWRCLVCDEPVHLHPSLLTRLWRKLRSRR